MSKKDEKASEKARVAPESVSVFDFIYCDSRRIASFLAQFDDFGVLDKIVNRESTTRASKRGWTATVGGGGSLMGTGAQGNASFGVTTEAGGSETSERFYDPLWTNARALLDYLHEHGLLNEDMDKATLGQFVLVKGSVILLDLGLLRGAWEKPPIQKLMKAGIESGLHPAASRQERRAQTAKGKSEASTETDAIIALLSLLPHTLQVRLVSSDASFWSTLDEDAVVGRSSDLILKHGALVGGEWHMLGVLNAYPYDPSYRNEFGRGMQEILAELAETAIGQMIAHLAPALQPMMGRPPSAWGITPLLIFRDVAKLDESPAI